MAWRLWCRRCDRGRPGFSFGLGLVVLLVLLAVACNRSSPTPTPPVTLTLPSGSGKYITVVAPADPPHLDVHQDVSEVLASLGPGLAYSRLLRLKSGPDVEQPSLQLECELCSSWEMPDPVTYVFHLREDVHWQDIEPVNGRPLVAQDLVYSYQRQRTDGWPNAGLLQVVDEMEALDDHTLRITLKYPDADFLLALADGHSKVVAREAVESQGHLREGPVVGSGPWIWVSTEPGVGTFLRRNPTYFEEELPKLDELRIIVIRDEETRYAVFATQTADVYPVSTGFLGRLREEVQSAMLAESRRGGAGLLLAMNVSKEPFSEPDVRRAVFKALTPWDDIDAMWEGRGYIGLGLPVVQPDWLLPSQELQSYFNDSEGSRALLQGAGVPSPLAFELALADYGETYLQQGRRVQEALRQVGFDPKARLVNPRTYSVETWSDRDYQMLLGPMPPASMPNGYLFSLLHSQGRWNITGHTDDTLDGLIEAQAVEIDVVGRGDLLRRIQRRLLGQAYFFVPVTATSVWASWPRVEGFHPNDALSEYFFWTSVAVEE